MGPTLKLNTADFELMLGGRYLLENSTLDGYLLEDGSGVLLLDTYVPQLGDPVTFTNPAWSGRVVSVRQQDIFDTRTNYDRVVVSATNATAAPGGTPPGDLSDVPGGGYFTLESGSGRYQLEDGSGLYEQEGTSYGYRHLSLRTSQNQDGSVTTYGSLETFEGGFAAGMNFSLTSVNLAIAGVTYAITNVTTTFIGANPPTPVYLIEFGDAYQTLQKAGGGVLTNQGSQANIQAGVAVPAGTLAYAQLTANQTGITTETNVTGLTATVTVPSATNARRLKVTAYLPSSTSTVAGDFGSARLYQGASQIARVDVDYPATTLGLAAVLSAVVVPTAGAQTFKVTFTRGSGTGSLSVFASATNPAYLLVEDIGT